jgi:hypothetical protein
MPSKIVSIDWNLKVPPSKYRFVPCNYSIHLLDPAGHGCPLPVPRFAGTDLSGTIEIGQTRDLATKIWRFRSSLMGTLKGDSEGWALYHFRTKNKWLKNRFGSQKELLDSIMFTFVRTDPKHLLANECKALDEYCRRFGEPPLTNAQVPGVTCEPGKHKIDLITERIARWDPATGPIPLGEARLADPPPNPLTGVPCIYFVQLMDRDDPSRPFPIQRFAGTDPSGTLVIGQTRNLAQRMRQIRSAASGNKSHGEWALFHHIYTMCTSLKNIYGPIDNILNCLRLSYIRTRSSLLVRKEVQAFNDYIRLYADLPPMNCQIPGNKRRPKK